MIRCSWVLVFCLTASAAVHFPVRFEPSEGGAFAVRAGAGAYWLAPSGTLRLTPGVAMRFERANPSPRCLPLDRLPGLTNDLRGVDPARWHTGIPQYGRVICQEVYPGIDLSFRGSSGQLEYDFQLAPGASTRRIVLDFAGASSVRLSRKGALVVHTGASDLRFLPPHISQNGVPVGGGYRLLGRGRVGFRVGRYDHARPLLIDPVLSLLALFGTQNDPIQAIATDSSGNVYLAGSTNQAIPLANPANGQLSNCSGSTCQSLFLAKFDPTGTQLLYSTYLGDNQQDFASGLAVDNSGNAYVSGTSRANLSTRDGRAFVVKVDAAGSAVVYTGYITGDTASSAVAVDSQGDAYLAGSSLAPDFPAVNALQGPQPAQTLFVTRDGGATWHSLNQGLPVPAVYSLAIDPTNPATLYAGTSVGLYKSLDGGATWTRLLPAAQFVQQVVVDPVSPNTLYAVYGASSATADQLAKSVDGGANWQVLTAGLPPPQLGQPLYIGSIAVDSSNSSVVWMATAFSVLESTDGGAHWTVVMDTLASAIRRDSISLVPGGTIVDPTNSSRVYVCCTFDYGGSPRGIYLTTDGGKTWTESTPTGGQIGIWRGMALDPADGSVVYVLMGGGDADALFRSTDAGQTWTHVTLPPNAPLGGYSGLAVDPSGTLSLTNDAGLLLRSPDGGATWNITQAPWGGGSVLMLDPTNPSSTFYVGSNVSPNSINVFTHAFVAKLDPSGSIMWATLLAGSQQDAATALAVDGMGNAYIGGYTNSTDFPLASPIQTARGQPSRSPFYQPEPYDGFVAKISADGSRLVYSTYLGGTRNESINRIAVDGAGNAYFAGETDSSDFPTAQAFESSKPPGTTSFLGKIDSSGQKLVFSTYLNPYSSTADNQYSPSDSLPAMAVDAQGGVWVAGLAYTFDFPLVDPIESSTDGAYLAKFNPSGGSLDLSTYFPGHGSISALAVSPSGNLWFAGRAYGDAAFPSSISPGTSNGFFGRVDVEPLSPPQPGVPLVREVFNVASWRVGDLVSPGELISLSGAELAPAAEPASALPLPQTLQGVRVTIGGVVAPLWYVSPTQINLQVPYELPLGSAQLVVQRGSQSSAPHALRVFPIVPGIFTFSGDGRTAPAVLHAADYMPVTASNPAHPGEYLTIYCTGLGVTAQSIRSGDPAPPIPVSIQAGNVSVGAKNVTITYAGLAPGFSGVDQVNVQLSPTLMPGKLAIGINAGIGNSSSNTVLIDVQ